MKLSSRLRNMKVALIIACVFATAQGFAVDPCSPGEEGACRSYATAENCYQTAFCKSNVWRQPINNETKLCHMCLDDVKNLQQFIGAKSTRQFVKYDLLAMCRAFPFEFARNECRSVIDEHFDKIYQDLVNKLDPSVVCRALRFCQSSDFYASALHEMKKNIDAKFPLILSDVNQFLDTDNATCKMCILEFNVMEQWSKDIPKDTIKEELLSFCDNVLNATEHQQECHNRVDLNFDLIYNAIVGKADPEIICEFIGLCDIKGKREREWEPFPDIQ